MSVQGTEVSPKAWVGYVSRSADFLNALYNRGNAESNRFPGYGGANYPLLSVGHMVDAGYYNQLQIEFIIGASQLPPGRVIVGGQLWLYSNLRQNDYTWPNGFPIVVFPSDPYIVDPNNVGVFRREDWRHPRTDFFDTHQVTLGSSWVLHKVPLAGGFKQPTGQFGSFFPIHITPQNYVHFRISHAMPSYEPFTDTITFQFATSDYPESQYRPTFVIYHDDITNGRLYIFLNSTMSMPSTKVDQRTLTVESFSSMQIAFRDISSRTLHVECYSSMNLSKVPVVQRTLNSTMYSSLNIAVVTTEHFTLQVESFSSMNVSFTDMVPLFLQNVAYSSMQLPRFEPPPEQPASVDFEIGGESFMDIDDRPAIPVPMEETVFEFSSEFIVTSISLVKFLSASFTLDLETLIEMHTGPVIIISTLTFSVRVRWDLEGYYGRD